MPYLLFLKSGKICNRRLLQIIGGTLRVNFTLLNLDISYLENNVELDQLAS